MEHKKEIKNKAKKYLLMMTISAVAIATTALAQNGTIKPRNLKANELKAIKQAFLETNLKDPSSVQLKDVNGVQQSKGELIQVCGLYNAKNGFGGYTGFETFYGVLGDKAQFGMIMTTDNDIANQMCEKRFTPK